jgi:hypothetical protein
LVERLFLAPTPFVLVSLGLLALALTFRIRKHVRSPNARPALKAGSRSADGALALFNCPDGAPAGSPGTPRVSV